MVDPLSALLIIMSALSDRFLMANLSGLEMLSTLFWHRLFVESTSSLTLSRYLRSVLPVAGFVRTVGSEALSFPL